MIAMNPTIQINDRHDWTKMGNSSSCLVAPYAKLMKMISGSACQRCHVKILAVSMGEFPRMGHGTNELRWGILRANRVALHPPRGPIRAPRRHRIRQAN